MKIDKRTEKQKTYNRMHAWLINKFGKATKCDGEECRCNSTHYEWALIQGKEYEKDINNYKMLCKSCHTIYDRIQPWAFTKGYIPWNKGKSDYLSESSRRKMGLSMARKCINIETGKIYETLKEACIDSNQKYSYTNQRLNGHVPNTKSNKIKYYEKD